MVDIADGGTGIDTSKTINGEDLGESGVQIVSAFGYAGWS